MGLSLVTMEVQRKEITIWVSQLDFSPLLVFRLFLFCFVGHPAPPNSSWGVKSWCLLSHYRSKDSSWSLFVPTLPLRSPSAKMWLIRHSFGTLISQRKDGSLRACLGYWGNCGALPATSITWSCLVPFLSSLTPATPFNLMYSRCLSYGFPLFKKS